MVYRMFFLQFCVPSSTQKPKLFTKNVGLFSPGSHRPWNHRAMGQHAFSLFHVGHALFFLHLTFLCVNTFLLLSFRFACMKSSKKYDGKVWNVTNYAKFLLTLPFASWPPLARLRRFCSPSPASPHRLPSQTALCTYALCSDTFHTPGSHFIWWIRPKPTWSRLSVKNVTWGDFE